MAQSERRRGLFRHRIARKGCPLLPISRLLLLCLLSTGAVAAPARAAEMEFAEWLDGVRQEALATGISAPTVDLALGTLEPIPHAIDLDPPPPPPTHTYPHYPHP